MGEQQHMVDGRNEYAVKYGVYFIKKRPVTNYVSKWLTKEEENLLVKEVNRGYSRKKQDTSLEYKASVYMARDHRTLQQTFSKIVFCFIKMEIPELDSIMQIGWEKCPLI